MASSEAVKYAIASSVVFGVLVYVPVENQAFTLADAVLRVITAAITGGGVFWVYQANGGAAGADFAARYLALGWVVGVRVVVVCLIAMAVTFLLMMIAMLVSAALAERELPDAWFVAAAIGFTLAAYLFFYWRLAVHMRDVAGGAVSQIPGRSPALV